MTLIDSNVIIDILTSNAQWLDWSAEHLNARGTAGPIYFNEIVYSELSAKSESEAKLDLALRDLSLQLHQIPKSAYFLAGKSFDRYRSAGGTRTSNLPDFFIGAHAQVAGLTILTRDVRRYRTYFPDVALISPEG